MKTELIQTLTTTFEAHARKVEGAVEYWLARDLQHLLGYTKRDNFVSVVSKAKTACELSGHKVSDHFADVGKTIQMPKGATKEVSDATEITIFNAREHGLKSEGQISTEHITNNKAVRKTLLERGIRPESLPPAEDVKKVERRLASEEKKSLRNPDGLKDSAEE